MVAGDDPATQGAPSHDRAQGPTAPFVSLYRRFRPGRFAELRGQPHVVRALLGAVRDDRVGHAYLFSGPRGTGKTSTARILARALNCAEPRDGEPCGTCASCSEIARGASLDVHELDAASNNGVDAMRDLISHAALGTPGRWKVYIVDEVHMLSTAAANALLKTLEEPPGHVVFVLATTDPQKVPPTIRSRTQHLEFGLLGSDTLTELLRDVNAAAGLELEDAALSVAVRRGRGSARDALSALDQVAASGSVEGIRPEVTDLVEALAAEDARLALVSVATLHEAGWGSQQLATELVDELRQAFLVALAPDLAAAVGPDRRRLADQVQRIGLARLVRAIEALGRAQVDLRDAPDPRAVLEVCLVRLARPELDDSAAALADRLSRVERALASGAAGGPAGSGGAGAPPQASVVVRPPEHAGAGEPEGAPRGDPAPAPGDAPAPGPQPALGALRRRSVPASAALSGSPATEGAPGATPGAAPGTTPGPAPGATPGAAPGTIPGPAPAGGPPVGGGTTASGPPPAGIDRDALVQAWGDHILRRLPARAKAYFRAGRFVSLDGGTATFALPNAAHRERCEEVRGVVEQAIAAHLGSAVALALVVDPGRPDVTTASGAREGSAGPGSGAEAPGLDPDDDFDPAGPTVEGSAEAVAHARVLEAFPGAEEVT